MNCNTKRISVKNYNIFEFYIKYFNEKTLYINLEIDNQISKEFYIQKNKDFINEIITWLKEIEKEPISTKLIEASINFSEDSNQYTFSAKSFEKNIKFNISKNEEVILKLLINKKIFIRKLKSSVYYTLKYKFTNLNLDKSIENIISDPFINTLKKDNNNISKIEVLKVKRKYSDYILKIDGKEIDTQRTIDIYALLNSTKIKDYGEFYFFTCSCGIPDCAAITEPIKVELNDGFIYWDMMQPYGGRFKFKKSQYLNEINKFK
ncbi:hypothetical protein [Arcobacter arenosus]|uniref:Uncharacterized protein n=1 Tax=Arcobacter arenosus TaxID=2576037 RepID=A0A5R8Y2D3_9BACT|nr:hypothetical protein [Arcobacter arenosus]TLP39423.1 hypothetical protein FDK22_06020 [Arcobacter arenosus]